MSKKFVGTTWHFEVDDRGFIHPNRNAVKGLLAFSVAALGSFASVAPVMLVGVGTGKFKALRKLVRIPAMIGVSSWVTDKALAVIGAAVDITVTADDIHALRDAVEYHFDVLEGRLKKKANDISETVKYENGEEKHSGIYKWVEKEEEEAPEVEEEPEDADPEVIANERAKAAVQQFKENITKIFEKLDEQEKRVNEEFKKRSEEIFNKLKDDTSDEDTDE